MQVDCGPIHVKGRCDGCGELLPRGRRAWCSNACERHVITNHVWQDARHAALERDEHRCVICKNDDHCARAKEWRRAQGRSFLEVNHITPVNGRRRNVDCQNHLDNLEVVCHDCHVALTKQQRKLGLIHPRRRHIWKTARLFGIGYLQCGKCGAVDTSVHPRGPVGQTVHYARRYKEECAGPLLKHLPRRRRKR